MVSFHLHIVPNPKLKGGPDSQITEHREMMAIRGLEPPLYTHHTLKCSDRTKHATSISHSCALMHICSRRNGESEWCKRKLDRGLSGRTLFSLETVFLMTVVQTHRLPLSRQRVQKHNDGSSKSSTWKKWEEMRVGRLRFLDKSL